MPIFATETFAKKISRREYKTEDIIDSPSVVGEFKGFNTSPNLRMNIYKKGVDYEIVKLTKSGFEADFYDMAGNKINYNDKLEWIASPKDDDLD